MRKSRISKKDIEALAIIINAKGYWSEEVLDFNEAYQPYKVLELHERAKTRAREIDCN